MEDYNIKKPTHVAFFSLGHPMVSFVAAKAASMEYSTPCYEHLPPLLAKDNGMEFPPCNPHCVRELYFPTQ